MREGGYGRRDRIAEGRKRIGKRISFLPREDDFWNVDEYQ
jgi:hypothetical protein